MREVNEGRNQTERYSTEKEEQERRALLSRADNTKETGLAEKEGVGK